MLGTILIAQPNIGGIADNDSETGDQSESESRDAW